MKEVIQGVCIKGDRCCVVGRPIPDDESHDCDAMGCSSVEHVLWRGTYEDETPTTADETFAYEVTDGKLIAILKAENERLRQQLAEAHKLLLSVDVFFDDTGAETMQPYEGGRFQWSRRRDDLIAQQGQSPGSDSPEKTHD